MGPGIASQIGKRKASGGQAGMWMHAARTTVEDRCDRTVVGPVPYFLEGDKHETFANLMETPFQSQSQVTESQAL